KVKGSVRRLIVTTGPNGRGAKDLGILPHRGPGYVSLNGKSGKGRVEWPGAGVKALYVHESSPLHGFTPTDAESMWLSGLPLVIFQRFKPSPLDEVAHVIIPGRAFTDKAGTLIKAVIVIGALLTGFAYLTLFERKVQARMQQRPGPNRVGPWGLLQPAADGLKLFFKSSSAPSSRDRFLYLLAPMISIMASLA